MRIFCAEPGIFSTPLGFSQLRRMIERVAQGQHELHLTDVDAVLQSLFFEQACPPMERIAWREIMERSATSALADDRTQDPTLPPRRLHAHLAAVTTSIDGTRRWSLTPENIGDWAETPLRLWLEDKDDWILLSAAAQDLGFAGDGSLLGHEKRAWLLVEGKGGCDQIKKAIQQHCDLQKGCSCPGGQATPCSRSARIFVIVDRDPKEPQNSGKKTQEVIKNECLLRHIPCHVLQRHEIENYIPLEIIKVQVYQRRTARYNKTGQRFATILKTLLALSPQDRDSADLKDRFGEKFMAAVMQALREGTGVHEFDPGAKEELRRVFAQLEETL